jgi:rfaE bifunctional protein kinase chain/domain
MTPGRFREITERYARLEIVVVGDFCLDRYFEIDPGKQGTSLETGLPVHCVTNIRSQPGGAGTILNNLVALGVGTVHAVGVAGHDGEGFELRRALTTQRGVRLDHFVHLEERRTFTYCKPLVLEPGRPPRELERLDIQSTQAIPEAIEDRLATTVRQLARHANALIVLSQMDTPGTGVIAKKMLSAISDIAELEPRLLIVADSRSGLAGYPPVSFKMNAAELARLAGSPAQLGLAEVKEAVGRLALQNRRPTFVTMSAEGIVGATKKGQVEHVAALPVRGPIDIVGAGDAVTANLAAALTLDATMNEALEIANAAASIVVHQLGTTGTASIEQIAALLFGEKGK